ncbi:DUF2778 domain-containing protein [Methylobacterium crusticola]|nr:DUF2778 domain-containing protein [Methylobacterium crusticola]
MAHESLSSGDLAARAHPAGTRGRVPLAVAAATLGVALGGLWWANEGPTAPAGARRASAALAPAPAGGPGPVQDPLPAEGPGRSALLGPAAPEPIAREPASPEPATLPDATLPDAARPSAEVAPPPEDREPARSVDAQAAEPARLAQPLPQPVPLPVPRPPELRRPGLAEPARRAERQAARQARSVAAPASAEDTRSFFEKLFGTPDTAGPALAYSSLESPLVPVAPGRRLGPVPNPSGGGGTAIYDISARIVSMPNGEKLEAHSGLGDSMDDPRHVHVRMRGPTPPGTYDLTEREKTFHGVRALRLTPLGGSAAIHGRAGLLAHTYMLGPSGASNGCVSFRDYDRFLQAYLRGEVQRLVVVPGRGQDSLPVIANGGGPQPGRPDAGTVSASSASML